MASTRRNREAVRFGGNVDNLEELAEPATPTTATGVDGSAEPSNVATKEPC